MKNDEQVQQVVRLANLAQSLGKQNAEVSQKLFRVYSELCESDPTFAARYKNSIGREFELVNHLREQLAVAASQVSELTRKLLG